MLIQEEREIGYAETRDVDDEDYKNKSKHDIIQ